MASILKVNEIELNSGNKLVLDGTSLDFSSSSDYYQFPYGTTNQRPTSGLDEGYVRYNSEMGLLEWYDGSSWKNGGDIVEPRTSNLQAYFDFVHGDEAYTSSSFNGQNSVRRIASVGTSTTHYAYTYGSTNITNGYVDFGNSQQATNWLGVDPFMNGYTNYTIEVFYSISSYTSSIGTLISGGAGNNLLMYHNSSGTSFNWENVSSSNYGYNFILNSPTQFCVTASGTNAVLYINGSQVATKSDNQNGAVVSGQLVFGQEKDGDGSTNFVFDSSQCFKGKIYCIRIYNAQLSATDVLNNYNSTITRF